MWQNDDGSERCSTAASRQSNRHGISVASNGHGRNQHSNSELYTSL